MKITSDSSIIKILLVQGISNLTINGELLGEGYTLDTEDSLIDAFKALERAEFDIVILNLNLPGNRGLADLYALMHHNSGLSIVVIVPDNQEDLGKEAMLFGALDYILEGDCQSSRLVKRVIRYALEKKHHAHTKRDYDLVLDLARKDDRVGSWTWYPQTDVLITTPILLEIFDLKQGKAAYTLRDFLDTVHTSDREGILETVKNNALKGESISLEFRIVTAENDLRHILIKGKHGDNSTTGEPMYYGTGQDITEIKQASETLMQKDRFLEMTGKIASVGGWEFDLITKELYWTSASYDIHGKPAEFKPTFDKLKELYPSDYFLEMHNTFYKAVSDKKDVFMEAPVKVDGRTKWLQYSGKVVFDGDEPVKINGIVYDISESKRQVKKLELRAMMLDNVMEAAVAIDKEYTIIFWNKAAEAMFGYSRSEAMGKHIAALNLAEVKSEEMKDILNSLNAGKNVSGEYNMIDKSGRKFSIWGSFSTIMETSDQPEALLFMARDISNEKEHLKKIEESEFRFRRLFEYSPVGKGLIDLKTYKWIDANITLIKLLGYSRSELLNSTMQDITPPEFSRLDLFHLKKLNRKGVFGPYQKEYLKSDGTRLKVIITGFVMNQAVGQKAWVHVLDITELDEKTESLRKSEERFRDYVESATDIILTIDENGLIDYISPNIKKTLEYSESEITGRSFLDFIHPEDKRNAVKVIERAMRNSEEGLSIIKRVRQKNGKYIYVQSEGKFRVAPTGEMYGIVIARNVDRAHRSELHVRKQNEILKEIAFIQSHILRRPLANILGLIALSNLNETVPHDTVELFELIKKEAIIMDDVVEDVVNKSTHISKLSDNE